MKDEIIDIIAEYLDVDASELDEHKTLEDLNIDSLDLVEIMFEIEEKFEVSVIFEMQEHKNELRNLGDMVRLTEELIVKHRASQPVEDGA